MFPRSETIKNIQQHQKVT